MNYKEEFEKWKRFLVSNSKKGDIKKGYLSVILPCGDRRVEIWELHSGGEAIYFDKKITRNIFDINGNEKTVTDWIEHNDFGPSRILSTGSVRYRWMGEDVDERQWAENTMIRLIKEVLDE